MNPLLPALVAVAVLYGFAIVCALSWSWMETRRKEERDEARTRAAALAESLKGAIEEKERATRYAESMQRYWHYWEKACYRREDQLREAAKIVRSRAEFLADEEKWKQFVAEIETMVHLPRDVEP